MPANTALSVPPPNGQNSTPPDNPQLSPKVPLSSNDELIGNREFSSPKPTKSTVSQKKSPRFPPSLHSASLDSQKTPLYNSKKQNSTKLKWPTDHESPHGPSPNQPTVPILSFSPPIQSKTCTQPNSSPISTRSKFEILQRPPKKAPSTSGSLGSSNCSGPLFPPGFEHNVTPNSKIAQVKKRQKKLEKKMKLRLAANKSANTPKPPLPSSSSPQVRIINMDDIVEMANRLGLSFNGSQNELRQRIQGILQGQTHDWENFHQ